MLTPHRGHIHDGGDHIVLKLNDKVICDSKAIYGKDTRDGKGGMGGHSHGAAPPSKQPSQKSSITDAGNPRTGVLEPRDGPQNWEVITEMTQCKKPVPVRKGDTIQMVSFYDGVKHPPRPTKDKTGENMKADEMGVFFINFAASKKTEEQLAIKEEALLLS